MGGAFHLSNPTHRRVRLDYAKMEYNLAAYLDLP